MKPRLQYIHNAYDFNPFWLCIGPVAVNGMYGAKGRTIQEAWDNYTKLHAGESVPDDWEQEEILALLHLR